MPSRSEPFLEAEVRRWGRFSGAPTDEQLSRFFLLGPGDLERVDRAPRNPEGRPAGRSYA